MPRKFLKPEDLTVIVDTREQTPWDMSPYKIENRALPTSDYSLKGMEHELCIERKSMGDLLSCVSTNRERFDKTIQRMLSYKNRLVVVEGTWLDAQSGNWRPKV